MLEAWLSVAKTFGSVVSFASTFAEKKRTRVAGYLDEIAANLNAMANAAEEGKKFATHCIKLRTASRNLKELCQGVTAADDLQLLAEQLNYAAASPGVLSQRAKLASLTGREMERTLDVLREAAAHLEAQASVLRAK